MVDIDVSFLPEGLRSEAIHTNRDREVMWPQAIASEVVEALAANGRLVLGLDLRSDGSGSTPPGLATEIPWSSSRAASVDVARDEALMSLRRTDIAEMPGYDWVLITWADATTAHRVLLQPA